jgi:hypothetical protein
MNRFSEIEALIMGAKEDFAKFYEKENKAAGTRVRNAMQELKGLAQDIRLEVQNIKNNGPAPAAPAKKAPAKAAAKPAAKKAAPAKKK